MSTALRITLKRGKNRRTFVLTDGPRPDIGDICTLNGEDWTVTKAEETPIIVASFSTKGGKLKQVFP